MTNGTIKKEDFEAFNEQLRQLLKSKYPLAEGFQKFSVEIQSRGFQEAVARIAGRLSEGRSLAEALAEEKGFSREYVGLIRAGEKSNNLLAMLEAGLDHERFLAEMEEGLKDAVFYPALIFCWISLFFVIAMVFVAPVYVKVYSDLQIPGGLPWLLTLVMALYRVIWLWLPLFVIGLWLLRWKVGLGSAALLVPGLRASVQGVYAARMAKTLGAMLTAGVRADDALYALSAATNDPGLKKKLHRAAGQAGEGAALSRVIADMGFGHSELAELVALGESAGNLPQMLSSGAELYRVESKSQLGTALRLSSVGLLVAVGLWVLLLLSSLMSAYFNIFNAVTL